ncbi:MAG TPA: hypothetical protein VHE12_06880 [bacterium]|nr:hypothetical protein [bacterium]
MRKKTRSHPGSRQGKPTLEKEAGFGRSFGSYGVLGSIVFFPCLFLGRVFFDGDLLNSNHIARKFMQGQLFSGHIPLWNPFLFGGQPFLADGDWMVCYPFLYPTLLFPVEYGFAIFHLMCFLIGALGMHLWLKALGLPEGARRAGALTFALSGYFWWEIIHPTELAAFAWVPWWAAALEKASEKLEPKWFMAAGLALIPLFNAGNFQLTMGALYGGALYLACRLLTRLDWRKGKDKDRRLISAPLFLVWGALPILAFWIPAWEFMSRCDRLHGSLDYATFQADYSLSPARLWQFFFPVDPFGGGREALRPMDDYLANGGYLGPWALFLAGLAFKRRKGPLVPTLAALGLAALLLAAGKFLPFHRLACTLVPGIGLARAPFRYVFLYVAAFSVLAAIGYGRLRELLEPRAGKRGIPKVLVAACLYGAAVLALSFGKDQAWPQWFGVASGLAAFFALWKRPKRSWPVWLFLGSLVLTLTASGWSFCTSRLGPASNFDWEARCPLLTQLRERTGLARTFIGDAIPYPVTTGKKGMKTVVPTDVAMATDIRNVSGYNPLCLQAAADLYSLPPGKFVPLLAVKGFLTGDDRWHIQGFHCVPWGDVRYCENDHPVSFVYAPRRVQTVVSDKERLALMSHPKFDPYQISFLSEPVSLFETDRDADLTYSLVEGDSDHETFQVSLDRAGYAVFSEEMYPGWKARVDGEPTALYTANHAFRALWLSEGKHRVEFRYEPAWGVPILGGLLLWALSLFLWRTAWLRRWTGMG